MMSMILCINKPRDYSVKNNYGIRKVDGTVLVLENGTMQGDEMSNNDQDVFLELEKLQRWKFELVPLVPLHNEAWNYSVAIFLSPHAGEFSLIYDHSSYRLRKNVFFYLLGCHHP